jgi:hypothetical protein
VTVFAELNDFKAGDRVRYLQTDRLGTIYFLFLDTRGKASACVFWDFCNNIVQPTRCCNERLENIEKILESQD